MDGLNVLLQATSVLDVSRCVDTAFTVRRLHSAALLSASEAEAAAGASGPAQVLPFSRYSYDMCIDVDAMLWLLVRNIKTLYC
jgi:hypothetical protein